MCESEWLAEIATGTMNQCFSKTYTKKDRYLEDYFEDEKIGLDEEDQMDNGLQDDELQDDNYEEHVMTNPPAKWHTSQWTISLENRMVWDFWIEVELLNYHYQIGDLFHNSKFHVNYNNDKILEIPMVVNCFFAHLSGKKITETDSCIRIPFELLTFLRMNKFPILSQGTLSIVVDSSAKCNSGKQILYFKSSNLNKKIKEGYHHIFVTNQVMRTIDHDYFYIGMCHFIIFDIDIYKELEQNEEAILEEIQVSLNGFKPIIYRNTHDEIISFTMHGKKFYAISFCPEFKNTSVLKQSHKNNKLLQKISGINFSRIDKADIKFVFDTFTNNKSISYQISSNFLLMHGNHFIRRYI